MQMSWDGGQEPQLLVAGGGIGAWAAALAARRAGWAVQLFEQAAAFSEVGAGLQLGPNATRILRHWGLESALSAVAAFPDAVVARSSEDGRELSRLVLGARGAGRYGAPYVTLHRCDLHALLMAGAQAAGGVQGRLGSPVEAYEELEGRVRLWGAQGCLAEGLGLIGADGLWSRVREQLLKDGSAQPTGHVAYRALIARADLPPGFRSNEVTAWLGPRHHGVTYPVRGGEVLNLVVIVQGRPLQSMNTWDDRGVAADVHQALSLCCAPLRDLAAAASAWGRWTLCDRPPVASHPQMACGRVALLGDAAHPMRPFLAQGAAMALEDAAALGQVLKDLPNPRRDLPAALTQYAQQRWPRAARVQAQSRRNGQIYHLDGPLRLGRDLALRALGARLMDVPWLYGYGHSISDRP